MKTKPMVIDYQAKQRNLFTTSKAQKLIEIAVNAFGLSIISFVFAYALIGFWQGY